MSGQPMVYLPHEPTWLRNERPLQAAEGVEIIRWDPERLSCVEHMRMSLACCISETYFPGWRADRAARRRGLASERDLSSGRPGDRNSYCRAAL
jgi:hypothetical protein